MLKIIESTGEDENGSGRYEIYAERDGKRILGFRAGPLCECPEDATLERNLGYAYMAVKFFKLGLDAAKNGEEVIFESKEMEE